MPARPTVEMTLYVRGNEPASVRAREALQVVVAGLPSEAIRIAVCDLERERSAREAAEDGVFTAPLVRLRAVGPSGPGPASWVAILTAENMRSRVEQMLQAAGARNA